MNGILTGFAITAGIDVSALGLQFATVKAETYPIGASLPNALPPQEVTIEESFGIATTPFTNRQLREVLNQLGPKNAVLMGELPGGTMKLFARGTEEEITGMPLEDMEVAIRRSVTLADLRNLEGGMATFDLQTVLANVVERGAVVLKERYDLIADEKRRTRFIGPDRPATMISWDESVGVALLLKLGLLSEIEWEAAARGKEGREFPTPNWKMEDDLGKRQGHFGEDWATGGTADVRSYPPIQIGGVDVYDLMGNVWEWTRSLYEPGAPYRVLRGGSWSDLTGLLRAAFRSFGDPDGRGSDVGFRLRGAPPGLLA